MARTADVVIMMLDATKGEVQRSEGWGRGQALGSGRCVLEPMVDSRSGAWPCCMGIVAGLSTG